MDTGYHGLQILQPLIWYWLIPRFAGFGTFLIRPICLCRATKADVDARFLVDVAVIAADRVMIAVRQLDILFDRNSHEEVFGVFVRQLYYINIHSQFAGRLRSSHMPFMFWLGLVSCFDFDPVFLSYKHRPLFCKDAIHINVSWAFQYFTTSILTTFLIAERWECEMILCWHEKTCASSYLFAFVLLCLL